MTSRSTGSGGIVGGRVLVTGGAGYVGSHTVLKLLEANYSVVVVDNLVNAYKDDAQLHPESLIRVQCLAGRRIVYHSVDITDEEGLSKVFDENPVDIVIHFAALKSVSESCEKPFAYYQNNIVGALTLIKVMSDHGVKTLVYSSSSTVYGTPLWLPLTESHPVGQGCTNPYGKTKYMVEEILRDVCCSDPSWTVISLRYFNPVGAHESGRIGEDPANIPNNLMPYIAQVAVGRLPFLSVFGGDYETVDGTGVRDYIHIQDLAEGHVKALESMSSSKTGFRAYNLGTGRGYSVLEVVRAFAQAADTEISYKIVGRRSGDVPISYCDASLAERELGWTAKKDIDDMCADMWRWQKMNPYGYAGQPKTRRNSAQLMEETVLIAPKKCS